MSDYHDFVGTLGVDENAEIMTNVKTLFHSTTPLPPSTTQMLRLVFKYCLDFWRNPTLVVPFVRQPLLVHGSNLINLDENLVVNIVENENVFTTLNAFQFQKQENNQSEQQEQTSLILITFLNVLVSIHCFQSLQTIVSRLEAELDEPQKLQCAPMLAYFRSDPSLEQIVEGRYGYNMFKLVEEAVGFKTDSQLPTLIQFLHDNTFFSDVNSFVLATTPYLSLPCLQFKFEGRSTREAVTFEGFLQRRKCAFKTCVNWVNIGLPYCPLHRKKLQYLEIKESLIEGAGQGVFASSPKATQTIVFQKGEDICLYEGETLNRDEIEKRYGSREFDSFVAPYVLQLNENLFIDGALVRGIGTMINHNPRKRNCRFSVNPITKKAQIKATKRIINGQELYLTYGRFYFPHPKSKKQVDIKQNHQTTKCVL